VLLLVSQAFALPLAAGKSARLAEVYFLLKSASREKPAS
jgi:hypothetical protein